MPRGNRMGPFGMGPKTGRGAGFCAGNDRPGFTEPGFGRWGRGRGPGFFGRKNFRDYRDNYDAPDTGGELGTLRAEVQGLGQKIREILGRLDSSAGSGSKEGK